jgi:hypothetical protein
MKFDEVIRVVGVIPSIFPKISQIDLVLYDCKDRIVTGSKLKFAEDLFKNNFKEGLRFINYLISIEISSKTLDEISVLIDEYSVILFYKTPNAKIFRRSPKSMSPLDYMD